MTAALRHNALHALGKRRIVVDRSQHRDRKTKARQAFPGAGRGITTRAATARIAFQAGSGLSRATPPAVTVP